jgi:pimeloyl-ACP methyl ester carboxylesterase
MRTNIPAQGARAAPPRQYTDAVEFLRVVREKYPGATLTVTGHSLGGALASYAGNLAGANRIVTFNAPSNNFSTLPYLGISQNHQQISVITAGDTVSDPLYYYSDIVTPAARGRDRPGNQFVVTPMGGLSSDPHGIDTVVYALSRIR